MLTIEQLVTTPNADEIFEQMLVELVAMGLPADKWKKGGVARSILRVVASSFAGIATIITLIAQAGFLNTATGDFLTLLARWVYGVERVTATFATGVVLVSSAAASPHTYQPNEFIVRNSSSKKTYWNVDPITISPGDTNVPIDVEATEAATASNASAGQVTELVTAVDGITVNNISPIMGLDAQTDEALRAECLAKLGALSMLGPRGAYAYAIQSAKVDGVSVNVNRWTISPSSSTGIVTIRIASPVGPVTSDDQDAVEENIEAVARPDTVRVDLDDVLVVAYTSDLTIWAKASPGLEATTIEDLVQVALDNLAATYPIGGLPKPPSTVGKLWDQTVKDVAQASHPAIFTVDSTGSDLTIPAGYVASITVNLDVRMVTSPAS